MTWIPPHSKGVTPTLEVTSPKPPLAQPRRNEALSALQPSASIAALNLGFSVSRASQLEMLSRKQSLLNRLIPTEVEHIPIPDYRACHHLGLGGDLRLCLRILQPII
jgi:hypothetical protein